MAEFDIDSFIAGVNRDKSKERGSENRLYKVLMNMRDYQGTVTMIPFISKTLGNIYSKIEGVKEWYGQTSLLDSGEAWYKILPISKYKNITATQIELYNEVVSLFDQAADMEVFGFGGEGILRYRNYSLFTGICIKHINTDNKKIEEFLNKACLFIFPSNAPIDALQTSIAAKADILGPRIQNYLSKIISPANTNREGVIQISFKKSTGAGYDSSISFETNDDFNTIVDPNKEFSEDLVSLFDDPLRNFIGWMYDSDNNSYFNELAFRELRDSLKLAIKQESKTEDTNKSEAELSNTNGSVDPMKMPPMPGVENQEKVQGNKKLPF